MRQQAALGVGDARLGRGGAAADAERLPSVRTGPVFSVMPLMKEILNSSVV